MKIHGKDGSASTLAEINIIPLVDVMLVLLIIFMITAPMMKQGVDVDLPEATAAAVSSAPEDMVLTVDSEGRIFLGKNDKTPYSLATLEEKLKTVFENKEKKELYLQADKSVRYGYVAQVMATCQRAGVERVGMVTVPEDREITK